MELNKAKLLTNDKVRGTGWLPPRPDLRDYSDQNEKIRGILDGRMRGGEREKGGKGDKETKRLSDGETKGQGRIDPAPGNQHLSAADFVGQSRLRRSKAEALAKVASTVDLREFCSPVEDQGQLGSCTSHAAAGVVEYFERKAFGKHLEASRLFLYKTTRNLMQTTGDTGAWIRCTMGALVMCGIPDEKYWPYDVGKFDKEPSAFVYSVANNFQTVKYFRHDLTGSGHRAQGKGQNPARKEQSAGTCKQNKLPALSSEPCASTPPDTLTSVKNYLLAGIPSIFGFWGFNSFDKTDTPGGIPYPDENEAAQWGHAVAAFGYDDKKKIKNLVNNKSTTGALLIRNSWGESWGEKGYGWLPYDYVLNGLAEDFWSLISMEWIDTGEFGF